MTQVLKNKTAVITGASQGLGAQIAHHFVAAGANVMLCARDANTLQTIANELRAHAMSPFLLVTPPLIHWGFFHV